MDAKSTHYHKLCEELKDGSPDVRAAEDQLTKVRCSTVGPVKYRKYVETRAAVWPILSTFYSGTMTTHATTPYKASGVPTISNGEPTPDYPVHRKLRLSAHINQQQADEQLVQSLHEKFGKDAVLVIGNWSAPMVRYHEPIRGKGLREMLQRHGFTVYLIDEFKTSKMCPSCETGALKTFKTVRNPRPYMIKKKPNVTCHGLLKCTNEKCLESKASRCLEPLPCWRLWNRDLAVGLNFRHILNGIRKNRERPERFRRGKRPVQTTDGQQEQEQPQPQQPPAKRQRKGTTKKQDQQ